MTDVHEKQFKRLNEGIVEIKTSIKFAKALHLIRLGKPQDGVDQIKEDHQLLKGQMKNVFGQILSQQLQGNKGIDKEKYAAIKERVSVSMTIADKDSEAFNKLIKEAGIFLVTKFAEDKLHTILSQYTMDISVLPHRMFSWAIQDVIFRCGLRDTLYIDLIQHQLTEIEIEKLKMKVDVKEIVDLLKFICKEFQLGKDLDKHVMQKLTEYQAATDFEDLLSEPMLKIENERARLVKNIQSYGPGSLITKHPGIAFTESYLESQNMCLESLEPIRSRYMINWYRNVVAQIILSNEMKLNAIHKEIRNLKHLDEEDSFGTKCSLNMYYVSIEQFKTKIDEWSEKYEVDLETTENENAMLLNSIQRVNEDLRNYQDRVLEMRQKVVDTLEKIAKEEEAAMVPVLEEIPVKRKSSKRANKKKTK